jgi:hypothetical protein
VSMTTLALAVTLAAAAAVAAPEIRRYRRAALRRRSRRHACPFEDDDDTPRPLAVELRDVLAEIVARARMGLLAAGGAHRRIAHGAGAGRDAPTVVVVGDGTLGTAGLAPLARRIADAVGAAVCVAPTGRGDLAARAARLADFVTVGRRTARGPLALVAYGDGGLVARLASRRVAAGTIDRLVTLGAAPVACAPAAPDTEVIAIYSLHDARVAADEAYDPRALNVAVRDVGHLRLPFAARVQTLVVEHLAADRAGAHAS